MSFVVDLNPTFTHIVKVKVPVDGGFKDQSFKATYAVIPTDEMSEYDLGGGEGSKEFLQRAVVGMSDLVDKDGETISYSDELRDKLLCQLYVRKALARTYFEAIAGAQAGN